MSASLPANPSLRQLQIQAKDLVKSLKQLQPEALARLRKSHPHFANISDAQTHEVILQLHDAQLVIAREYGFDSWTKLRAAVDRVTLGRLVQAVQCGDVSQARAIVRDNPGMVNFDMSETDEHRVIHYAVLRRDEPMVRALMRAGADAQKGIYPHRDATTAYVLARDRGFAEIAAAIDEEEQLRRIAMSCPNATVSSAQDRLYEVIRNQDHESAIAMLETEPSLTNACDREGGTALYVACEEAALPVVEWLLDHRANPRKKNLKGCTPLEAAVLRVGWKERARTASFPEVAQRILSRGAAPSPLVAAALGDLEELRLCDRIDPTGMREMHRVFRSGLLSVAVTFGQLEALKLLLDLGLDPNERHRLANLEEEVYSYGQPLWLAAAFDEYEMAAMLLEYGADANAQVYASGTPVSRAYGTGDARMKLLLAQHGGRPEPSLIGWHREFAEARSLLETDSREETVSDLLWGAACGGSPEIVELCLGRVHWMPTDFRWFRLLTGPLSLANHAPHSEHPERYDRSTYPECLRLILQHGASVNTQGRKGETLMHTIMAAGKIWGQNVMTDAERAQFARIALKANPDLTVRDDILKSTPLGWACRWGREALVRMLIDGNAPVLEPDAEVWATPQAWAEKMGFTAISALLRECSR